MYIVISNEDSNLLEHLMHLTFFEEMFKMLQEVNWDDKNIMGTCIEIHDNHDYNIDDENETICIWVDVMITPHNITHKAYNEILDIMDQQFSLPYHDYDEHLFLAMYSYEYDLDVDSVAYVTNFYEDTILTVWNEKDNPTRDLIDKKILMELI